MVPSMHQVKLSPLCRTQRTQNRMVEHADPPPKAAFTLRNERIHRCNLGPELVSHFLRRQAFRPRHRRCLASGGHVTQSHHDQGLHAMRHRGPRSLRLSARNYLLKSPDRSRISQVQMFQHLGRAPLARGMPAQLLGGHAFHRRIQISSQLVQSEIHSIAPSAADRNSSKFYLFTSPIFAGSPHLQLYAHSHWIRLRLSAHKICA